MGGAWVGSVGMRSAGVGSARMGSAGVGSVGVGSVYVGERPSETTQVIATQPCLRLLQPCSWKLWKPALSFMSLKGR